jgi:hypothetical protein
MLGSGLCPASYVVQGLPLSPQGRGSIEIPFYFLLRISYLMNLSALSESGISIISFISSFKKAVFPAYKP